MEEALGAVLEERGLLLRFSVQKGRCIFAAKNFLRGEVVLGQSPYASALDETVKKRCDGCYKKGTSVKRCASCRMVYYCSAACQKQEWPMHRYECKCLVALMEEQGQILTPSLRLMLRLLIKKKLQHNKASKHEDVLLDDLDDYEIVETLPTHFEEVPEQKLVLYSQMARLVKSAYRSDDVEIKEITENFCRLACNAHTILDEELKPLGTGLYPVLSLINHSCCPNCIISFEGKKANVRAVEPIRKGSEITVTYVELGSITATRQKILREQYFFDCHCSRCERQMLPDGKMEDALMEGYMCTKCEGLLVSDEGNSRDMLCQRCGAKYDQNMIQKEMEKCASLLDEAARLTSLENFFEARSTLERLNQHQAKILKNVSLHRIKTFDNLVKICMSLEDWASALQYCRQSIPSYKRVYTQSHPLLGLQFYACGKLEWYLENTTDAINSFKEALQILEITHGPNAELVINLKLSLHEAEAEAQHLGKYE